MRKLIAFTILLLSIIPKLNAQDRSDWFEFYLPWDDSTESITNMSAYLDAPAGKYGFMEITPEGHFSFENADENIRFAGVVNVAIANFPEKILAPILAARMAKYGINLVRIHLIDVEREYGLFENSSNNTLELSESRLDKMDYLIHCMKEKGIYFNFCIHAGRMYKEADGIPAALTNNQCKYVTIFDEKVIELQKQFASQTIGHVNPYTGLSYADDPAMVSVELTNENQLYNGWYGWQRDFLFAETEEGIGPYYAAELDTMFNDWLKTRYPDNDALASAWSGNSGESTEMVLNPSFENDFSAWSKYVATANGAVASIDIDDTAAVDGVKSARISVSTPGTASWHIQMKTNNMLVEESESYKISFYTKSDSEDDFGFQIMENDTWKWIANPSVSPGEKWKKIEYFFTCPFDSEKLIIQFDFGSSTGTFWLDSVSITKSGGIGLEEEETLELANIQRTPYSQIGKHSKRRVGDNARFYFDVEGDFIESMMDYLKNDLSIKVPVTFTNNNYGLASIYSQSRADYIDFHMYWDHPNYPNGWSDTDFTMKNLPMVKNPEASTINKMSLCRVEGMPLVLSEYNHPYPHIYQCEAPSLLYAYGGYLDLDGILWHAYYDYMGRFNQRPQDMFFDIAMHPVMMTQLLLSIPYRLGYIQPASHTVSASYKEQDVFDNTKLYQANDVLNIKDEAYGISLLKDGFQHSSFTADSTMLEGSFSMPSGVIHSDADQLNWDGSTGIFKVNNPFWQGATGFLKNQNLEFDDITLSNIETSNDFGFGYVHLISMDSLPISESKKLVLLTGARLENEGFEWNATQTSPVSIGGTRALCEPITGKLSLNFSSRDSFAVYRLDEKGLRSEAIYERDTSGNWSFEFNHKTLWYEILNDSAVAVDLPDTIHNDTTGIAAFEVNMHCYPNPCSEYLNLEFENYGDSNAQLLVYNARGQQVLSRELIYERSGMQRLRIDLSAFDQGLYFYGLRTARGTSSMKKLIKFEQP